MLIVMSLVGSFRYDKYRLLWDSDRASLCLDRGGKVERRRLEYFLAVIEHGGFTTAAAALRISQPSLSYAIKTLERDLGAVLFHRLPRGVRLTDAGEAFAESARLIVREIETARAQVEAIAGLVAGRLDVVSLPGLVVDPLAPAIRNFHHRHPKVRIRIEQVDAPTDVRDAVRTGTAELGLTDELHPTDRDLTGELLTEQELVAALPPGSTAPPDGAMDLRTLLHTNLVTGPPGGAMRDFLAGEAAKIGHEFSPAIEVTGRGSTLYLALAGVAVIPLPRPLAELARLGGAVIVPLRPRQSRHVYLLRRGAFLSPAARTMCAVLRDQAACAFPGA
ncbi:MAG: LysR family transcriptional regulator [Pseudonocardiaceae bacterium]|nr:LysR family transcriptional regulator [Pseudonocardiaceae bacterium]